MGSKPSRKKRVTLADVAAKAGVSVATASVAITGRPSGNCRVSPAVAERIRAAARELKYRPNLQARNLSTQRTRTVAMLIKRASWHNAIFYVEAMQRVLRARGYSETFMLHPDNRLESEREHLELCVERCVEGIITIPLIDLEGRANTELYNRIQQDDATPIVQLGIALPGCAAPSVLLDDRQGVRGAVRLLHSMGHRHIAHLTVPRYDDPGALNPFKQPHLRYEGYRQGLADVGLREQVFCAGSDWWDIVELYDRAYAIAPQIIAAAPMPTAVIACIDYMAAGLISGLRDAGVRVPAQVSVLGMGDLPFSRMLRPALSTLAPPYEQMGELATQTLLSMIEQGGRAADSAVLPPALVMRDTVREIPDPRSAEPSVPTKARN